MQLYEWYRRRFALADSTTVEPRRDPDLSPQDHWSCRPNLPTHKPTETQIRVGTPRRDRAPFFRIPQNYLYGKTKKSTHGHQTLKQFMSTKKSTKHIHILWKTLIGLVYVRDSCDACARRYSRFEVWYRVATLDTPRSTTGLGSLQKGLRG